MSFFRKVLVVSLSVTALIFMVQSREMYAEVLTTAEEALKILLPDETNIKEEVRVLSEEQKKIIQEKAKVELNPEFDNEFPFYVSSSGIVVLNTIKGKWGPIKLMMSFDGQGKVKDIIILEFSEKRGQPVKERKFLKQYIGKSIKDPVKLNKDIKVIAGATISSRQMTDGVRKLIYVYEEFYQE